MKKPTNKYKERNKDKYRGKNSDKNKERNKDKNKDNMSYLTALKKNLYKIPNVILIGSKLYTKNITPKMTFFEIEETIQKEGNEYRFWDPTRSKLCAGLFCGLSQIGIKQGSRVLYLGASHGYTPSFVSDIIGKQGMVYALDFAPRVVKDLVFMCEKRKNMLPVLEDANHPKNYEGRIGAVDIVFQDIAQKNQLEIFVKNCEKFLNKGGFGILALKARSVNVAQRPQEIFRQTLKDLEEHLVVVDYKDISHYEKDHAIFVVKRK